MTAEQALLVVIWMVATAFVIAHLKNRLNKAVSRIESLETSVWHLYEALDLVSPSPSAAPDEDE